ncbi:MAG: IS66 family transposase [Lachnospiraceae bacterium]|nr:IS66 family transposase [Lachnospiraceae bacterium]
MNEKDAYIMHLENTIKDLQNQVSNLTEMIMLLRKDKFGSSSEKTPKDEIPGQLSLFNEAEVEAEGSSKEPIKKSVKGYLRTNLKTKRDELIKDIPVREVPCDIPDENKVCGKCGTPLKPLGKETVREELEYIPAQLRIVRYVRWTYECPKCKHSDKRYIVKAPVPTSLMNHSLASPSSVAQVMYEKYVNSVPLYRQEKDWEQLGISLSRATMANWIIRCSEDYLIPVINRLRELLLKRDIVHCDETPVQVLKEDGKKPQTKSYMWLYRTGNDDQKPIILYDYQPSRNGDHAVTFLKNFNGYVHSDGYQGYNKLTGITRCGCWAHLRRKFVEAIPAKKAEDAPMTAAEIGRDYCNQLFEIEKSLKGLSAEDRYLQRQELEKPVLEAFWCWLEKVQPLRGSALGKAVTYAKNQKPYMENYLLDGRLSISNNAAENAIRPFTVGRKNWLFADTPKGATASAAVYSLVETAKANGLNVYTYLEYLLMYMPDTDWRNYPEDLDDLMPWAPAVQEECKML